MTTSLKFTAFFSLGLAACAGTVETSVEAPTEFLFEDITQAAGLVSEKSMKYGGPSLADFTGNGRYDFAIGNHNIHPMELWYTNIDGTVTKREAPLQRGDVHGAASADYDGDGDVDIIISVGGGNGKMPAPPRLLRNDNGQFTDVTATSGLQDLGARGRTPRWIDMDLDGDLDLLHVVARQLPGETGPRNTIFENVGSGKFEFRESPGIQEAEAERAFVTDFNNDNISDLVLFEPITLWQGDGSFVFKDVTAEMLPSGFKSGQFITTVSDADIDNDGDRDLYLSRGKTYYQIANNSIDFDPKSGRLDLRDKGLMGQDGMSFEASGDITLQEFWHWERLKGLVLPVYLGADKVRIDTPVDPTVISRAMAEGIPDAITENGWYLGHVGNGKWRLKWSLDGDIAWDVRGTITGLNSVRPDWKPQDYNNVPDVLLENKGGRFVDISDRLPAQTHGSNWGVTNGDFDNDGYEDFFVYRFGKLSSRVPDVLLRNVDGQKFVATTTHDAYAGPAKAHGDMGAAFDFDMDGKIDLLNGDDDLGYWHLYKNQTPEAGNYLIVSLGYSDQQTDPMAATVTVKTASGLSQTKDVGSAGANHTQSLMSILHFGVGSASDDIDVTVRWRDGTTKTMTDLSANQILEFGDLSYEK